MRQLAPALMILLLIGALACDEEDQPEPDAEQRVEAEAEPTAETSRDADRPAVPAKPKPVFDTSRVPERIQVVAPPRPVVPRAARVTRMGKPEPCGRYPELKGAVETPALKGFDLLTFAPSGWTIARRDVEPSGEATLLLARGGVKTHMARVRRYDSATAARQALATRLAGYQGKLERVAHGDDGYALRDPGQVVARRVLLTRSNLLLQAWSLGDESAEELAVALAQHAARSPRADGQAAARHEAHLDGEHGEGRPIPCRFVERRAGCVAHAYRVLPDGSITGHGERTWLISPTPGKKQIELTSVDRWLRVTRERLTVVVR